MKNKRIKIGCDTNNATKKYSINLDEMGERKWATLIHSLWLDMTLLSPLFLVNVKFLRD